MPKVYRVMQAEGDRPKIGSSATTLGVRLPGGSGKADIVPDDDGSVKPGTGGMSVAPTLWDLPPTMVPKKYRHLVPQADGRDHWRVWAMGEGAFIPGLVTSQLQLRPDPDRDGHGFIEPAVTMPCGDYLSALHATQPLWDLADE